MNEFRKYYALRSSYVNTMLANNFFLTRLSGSLQNYNPSRNSSDRQEESALTSQSIILQEPDAGISNDEWAKIVAALGFNRSRSRISGSWMLYSWRSFLEQPEVEVGSLVKFLGSTLGVTTIEPTYYGQDYKAFSKRLQAALDQWMFESVSTKFVVGMDTESDQPKKIKIPIGIGKVREPAVCSLLQVAYFTDPTCTTMEVGVIQLYSVSHNEIIWPEPISKDTRQTLELLFCHDRVLRVFFDAFSDHTRLTDTIPRSFGFNISSKNYKDVRAYGMVGKLSNYLHVAAGIPPAPKNRNYQNIRWAQGDGAIGRNFMYAWTDAAATLLIHILQVINGDEVAQIDRLFDVNIGGEPDLYNVRQRLLRNRILTQLGPDANIKLSIPIRRSTIFVLFEDMIEATDIHVSLRSLFRTIEFPFPSRIRIRISDQNACIQHELLNRDALRQEHNEGFPFCLPPTMLDRYDILKHLCILKPMPPLLIALMGNPEIIKLTTQPAATLMKFARVFGLIPLNIHRVTSFKCESPPTNLFKSLISPMSEKEVEVLCRRYNLSSTTLGLQRNHTMMKALSLMIAAQQDYDLWLQVKQSLRYWARTYATEEVTLLDCASIREWLRERLKKQAEETEQRWTYWVDPRSEENHET